MRAAILKQLYKNRLAIILLMGYIGINVATLMSFPMVHSDELWLKGIADEVIFQNKLWITEPFFDLYPRVAHPFRWLYIILQQIAILLAGDGVVAMRLLSLGAGIGVLTIFFKCLKQTKQPALLGTLLLALNSQFIYALHFGRQEMLVLLIQMLLVMSLYNQEQKKSRAFENQRLSASILNGAYYACLVFLGIGIHPNSFLLGLMTFAMLCALVLKRRISYITVLAFVCLLTASFLGLVFWGEWHVPGFFKAYLAYGASLGLDAMPGNRLTQFFWYFYKLFFQIGGTYDLLNIRIWLIGLLLTLLSPLFQKKITLNWVGLVAMLVGLFVLGRNNQLAILFMMPFLVYALMQVVTSLKRHFTHGKYRYSASILGLALGLIACVNLAHNSADYRAQHFYNLAYSDVIHRIDTLIPDDANVLGNLNMIEAHPSHQFWDIRNLAYLAENQMTFASYIEEHKIHYLIIHDEMAYIGATQPTWDILYGPLSYAPEMNAFLKEHCEIVSVVDNPIYAMRIAKYSGTYPWQTTIYRVMPETF